MKKIQILILLLILSITAGSIPAAAAQDFVLLETTTQEAADYGVLTPDTQTVRSYAYSGKWENTHSDNPILRFSFDNTADLSAYQYVNFWVSAEQRTGSTINIALFSQGENGKEGYYLGKQNVDYTGWKLVSLPLSSFTQKNEPNLGAVTRIDFDARVWGSGDVPPSPDTVLYCEKIWLSVESPSAQPPVEERFTVAQFDSEAALDQASTGGLSADYEIKNHYGMSARWERTDTDNKIVRFEFSETDLSNMGYLNLWVHSQNATGSTINLALFTSVVTDGKQSFVLGKLNVDFTGWKLVSLPLSEFDFRYDPDLKRSVKLELDARAWDATDGAASPDTVLNLESIWLSRESEQEQPPQEQDEMTVVEFDSEEKIAVPTHGTLQLDTQVKKHYDFSARWEELEGDNSVIRFEFPTKDITQQTHLNLWLHSQKATGATINIAIFTSVYTDGTQSFLIGKLNVDWEGWKLISLSLENFRQRHNPDLAQTVKLELDARIWDATDTPVGSDTVLCIEKIYFAQEGVDAFQLISQTPVDGYDDFPAVGGEIAFVFNQPVEESSVSDAVICSVPVDIAVREAILSVKPREELPYGSQLEISIGENLRSGYGYALDRQISTKVTVLKKDLWASVPVFLEDKRVETTLHNPTESERPAALLIGTEEGCWQQTIVVPPGESRTLQSEPVEEDTAICVVVDAQTRQLLHSGYGCLPDGVQLPASSAAAASSIQVSPPKVTETVCTIAGTLSGDGARTILLCIEDEMGNSLFQVMNAGGDFSWTAPLDTMENGWLSVQVSGRNCGAAYTGSVYYADEEQKRLALSEVNEAKSAVEAKAVLDTYWAALGLEEEANREFLAQTIIEQGPYESFSQLQTELQRYGELLKELNECVWSNLGQFLRENHEIILYESSQYAVYTGYSTTAQNSIHKSLLTGTYSDFITFRAAFDTAVASYQSSSSGSGGGGGSGSGGGGGSSRPASGGVTSVQYPTEQEETAQESFYFQDMDQIQWAKEPVERLLEAGIIAMDESRRFRPEDSITREEFLKLLLESLELTKVQGECDFSDVSREDWFYPYVASAVELEICKGQGDGTFGAGETITRQDMAVMAQRAADAAGLALEAGEPDFIDKDTISDYAKDAAGAMLQANIISGVGEGRFAPLEKATRAQAAKIIDALRSLYVSQR